VYRLRYREKREEERRELYVREVCPLLPAPLAVRSIYTCNTLLSITDQSLDSLQGLIG